MKAVVWHDVGKVSTEAVGVVEDTGPDVRNFNIGDRVVIPSTIACGSCVYCRAGYYAQCDNANPNGEDPTTVWSRQEAIPAALQAYGAFDRREPGWTKVTLEVA